MAKQANKRSRTPERKVWQLQTAKAQFSELFRRARKEGPQWVTKHGGEAVVVLPAEEFERLKGRQRPSRSLKELLLGPPWRGANIEIERSSEYDREVDL
jgi:prevent-host-death family protein